MTEIYGRIQGPRLVRNGSRWMITGRTDDLDATDLLWLAQSVDAERASILIDALYGGGRKVPGLPSDE